MGRAHQGIWAEHGRVYGQSTAGYMGRACQDIWAEHVRVYGQSMSGYMGRAHVVHVAYTQHIFHMVAWAAVEMLCCEPR